MSLWKLSQLFLSVYFLIGIIPEANGGANEVTVKGILGGTAILPCNRPVDQQKCGTLYYTTWAKNIHNEWKRIYLKDGSIMEKALQSFELQGRAKLFENDTHTYLQISSLRLADEGSYRCDITYTKSCPSLTFLKLVIQVQPSPPEIKREGSIVQHMSDIGPFYEESSLSLDCETTGGKPTADVTWWKNDEIVYSELEHTENIYGSEDVKSSIDLVLTREDIGAVLKCKVKNEALDEPLEAWVNVDLKVQPLDMDVEGPTKPVLEGETIELNCTVEGAKPAAVITWYNGSEAISTALHISELEIKEMEDGTYNTFSELQIVASKYDHEQTFYCEGTNEVLTEKGLEPLKQSLDIEVVYAPVVIIEPEEGIVVNESSKAILNCSFDANPDEVNDVKWYKDNEELPISENSKYSTLPIEEDTKFPILTIYDIDREDDSGMYSCSLSNAVGRGNSSNSVEITVLYPPVVKAHVSPSTVNESEKSMVLLVCDLESGNPENILRVRWYKDDEFVFETTDKEITLGGITRNQTGYYSCEGENAAGWGNMSNDDELIVQYLPGEADVIELDEPSIKGETVTLICDLDELGLPEANSYYWELDGERIENETDKNLTIEDVNLHTEGNYSCTAINNVGPGEEGYHFLHIKAPPKFITKVNAFYSADVDTGFYNVTCRVECDPICDIMWFKDGESIMDSDFYIITTDILPEDEYNKHFMSVESSLKWNMTAWPDGKLERKRDNANYSCKSTSNDVGEHVESSMQFSVEYAPEIVNITESHMAVEEGDSIDPINCSAESWPPSVYIWKFGNMHKANGPTLQLDDVSRDQAGIYTCLAKNIRGEKEGQLFLEVLFKPECQLIRTEDDDETILTCKGKANPNIVKFIWTKDNETISDFERHPKDMISFYRFPKLSVEHFGEYQCVITNEIGESEPCEEEVTGPIATVWDPNTSEKKIFIIAAVVGGLAILFLIIIIIIIIIMRRRRSTVISKPGMEDLNSDPQQQSGMGKQQIHITMQTNGSPILRSANTVTTLRRMEDKRRRLRSIADASAAKPTPSEALYQNIEASDHKENGLSEPESKPMYENMPFFGRNKGPFRPDINDDLLYADMYDDVKLGKVPDPRMKPPLPPKGIGKKPKEPPLPPKTRKKAPSGDII